MIWQKHKSRTSNPRPIWTTLIVIVDKNPWLLSTLKLNEAMWLKLKMDSFHSLFFKRAMTNVRDEDKEVCICLKTKLTDSYHTAIDIYQTDTITSVKNGLIHFNLFTCTTWKLGISDMMGRGKIVMLIPARSPPPFPPSAATYEKRYNW